jgi:hypothetical protein
VFRHFKHPLQLVLKKKHKRYKQARKYTWSNIIVGVCATRRSDTSSSTADTLQSENMSQFTKHIFIKNRRLMLTQNCTCPDVPLTTRLLHICSPVTSPTPECLHLQKSPFAWM